jgi:1A family penicillin-binding protein
MHVAIFHRLPRLPAPRTRGRLVQLTLLGTLALLAVGAGVLWATYRGLGPTLPSLVKLEEARPVGGTLVLGANRDTLASFYREKRVNVRLEDVPRQLKGAVLSVEDWRFYDHWGIDLWGLARAVVANLRHGWGTQGASTLTQQLARNLVLEAGPESGPRRLGNERTLARKIKEAVLTLRIERTYTKDEILRMYLNQIYFGEGAYGVEAAARTYFGKSVRDLDLIESATLAGLPKNPNNYSPIRNPERALRRRNIVLRTMVEHKLIREGTYDSLAALPIATQTTASGDAPGAYFVEEVRKYLESKYGSEFDIYSSELRVFTTLDLELQRSMERAVDQRFRELETTYHLPHPWVPHDSLGLEPTPYLQAAALAMDPHAGRVLAMVGGRSFKDSHFNRAIQARRQPGSAFKPMVYAAALETGHTPADILLDTPLVMEMGGGRGLWKPQNYDKVFNGPVSLRFALAKSLNIPAVKLQDQVGTDKVTDAARRMGIQSHLEPVLSLALGTSEVTLVELTAAYGTLANGGIYSQPWWIERVEDRDGKVLEQNGPHHEEALDPQVAYVLTHMLESVVDWGTGHNAREVYGLTIPVAGKTGTTDDTADGWFIGYTPDLVVGVWGGYDVRRSIGLPGSVIGLPAWCDIMRDYAATHPSRPFTAPDGIVTESVCADSGKLATPNCPNVVSEIFMEKFRPQRECDLHTLRALDLESSHELDEPEPQVRPTQASPSVPRP